MNKIFIVGLPRTGTTSICTACLDLGFTVAHIAYTQETFNQAQVIADLPVFCDYPKLDQLFPSSKFIYLDRAFESWMPSIQILLSKLNKKLSQPTYKPHALFAHSYRTVFAMQDNQFLIDAESLRQAYENHRQQVFEYFSKRDDFLAIDISDKASFEKLLNFLDADIKNNKVESLDEINNGFPHVNKGGKITYWKSIKHPNKINSNLYGENGRQYF